MLIASMSPPFKLSPQSALKEAEALEICLEKIDDTIYAEIAEIRKAFNGSLILTLEINEQDPNFGILLQKLAQLKPEYITLSHEISDTLLITLQRNYPSIQWIGLYHHVLENPTQLINFLKNKPANRFDRYKVITAVNTTVDALAMLQFIHNYHETAHFLARDTPVAFFCQGLTGKITEILSPLVNNPWHYINAEYLAELIDIYHLPKLNQNSKIFALLGNPVDLSVGHILHNQAIQLLNENAVYVKLQTPKQDLTATLQYCRQLPFSGFSVTMPLKETIFSKMDEIGPQTKLIQAVNSIVIEDEKLFGFNTDGIGAIEGLIKAAKIPGDLTDKKIVILGAGGSARAIAYAAHQYNAKVIIINRTFLKAQQLAQELEGKAYALDQQLILKNLDYDILINTLPEKIFLEQEIQPIIQPQNLRSNAVVMDIVYQPIDTILLKIAREAQCLCIPGYEMYIHQALLQIKRWYNPNDEQLLVIEEMMEKYFNP